MSLRTAALGTLEATRFAAGRKNANCFEINGEKGSIRFNLERFNEMEVFWNDDEPKETRASIRCWSQSPTTPGGRTGGPRAT